MYFYFILAVHTTNRKILANMNLSLYHKASQYANG